MAYRSGLDRRTFLRSAATTALLGAAGVKPAAALDLAGAGRPDGQLFDFDEVYDLRAPCACTAIVLVWTV